MSGGAAGAAGAAAAAGVVIAQAIKASGAIVEVSPDDFMNLMDQDDEPLIVVSQGGTFKKHFQYLAGYHGLVFYTKSPEMLQFIEGAQVVQARKIWIPG